MTRQGQVVSKGLEFVRLKAHIPFATCSLAVSRRAIMRSASDTAAAKVAPFIFFSSFWRDTIGVGSARFVDMIGECGSEERVWEGYQRRDQEEKKERRRGSSKVMCKYVIYARIMRKDGGEAGRELMSPRRAGTEETVSHRKNWSVVVARREGPELLGCQS